MGHGEDDLGGKMSRTWIGGIQGEVKGRDHEGDSWKLLVAKKLLKGPQNKSTLLLSLPIANRIASLSPNHSSTRQNFIALIQALW